MSNARCFISQKPEGGIRVLHIDKPTDAETDSAVARMLAEISQSLYDGETPLTCTELPFEAIPKDRYFRDAWEGGEGALSSVRVNMPKARAIHMARIRRVRDTALAELDGPYNRAIESGDIEEQKRIARKRQALRDIPENFDLMTESPEDLRLRWPDELPAQGG